MADQGNDPASAAGGSGSAAPPPQHAASGGARRLRWELARNRALTHRQSMLSLGLLGTLTLAVAVPSTVAGTWAVLPSAVAEIAVIGLCYVQYARHAADGDRVTLSGDAMEVVCRHGTRQHRHEMNPLWVTVCLEDTPDPKILIRHAGHSVRIGQHVSAAVRRHAADEMKRALARIRSGTAHFDCE